MTTLTYDTIGNLVAGHQADINDVKDCFVKIAQWTQGSIDAGNLATSAKPVTLLGQYRTVTEGLGFFSSASSTGVSSISMDTLSASTASNTATKGLVPILAADHAVSGLTTKYRIRGLVAANAVNSTRTFTFGLYPITASNGTVGDHAVTIGTLVAGSASAIATPGASGTPSVLGSDFTPPADGLYTLGVSLSGIPAANSAGTVYARLEVHHV